MRSGTHPDAQRITADAGITGEERIELVWSVAKQRFVAKGLAAPLEARDGALAVMACATHLTHTTAPSSPSTRGAVSERI